MKQTKVARLFILASLIALSAGLFFGVIGSIQYILPEFLRGYLPFTKTRPLHVTLVIIWIFNAATGSIYYFLPEILNQKIYSVKLSIIHFSLFIFSTVSIIICYFFSQFGGREYLEYPPILAVPVILSWIFFLINFFKTVSGKKKGWPVYLWMWSTGIIFFLITYFESYLWLLPYFRDNIVRDVTVQWKSLGSMVGSWNMLVYGIAFYIMEKLSGNEKISRSNTTFFFYFLGLTNLMFNWGHHSYIVPAAPYVKNVSYIISMTELFILGNIIWNWKKSLSIAIKNYYSIPYRFLMASEFWIFLNLILAIIISIPSINYYTHGTHVTVAHSMGATIGINTMILFASLFYILKKQDEENFKFQIKNISFGFWLSNISLIIFWLSLISAGIVKAIKMKPGITGNFALVMSGLSNLFEIFLLSGVLLFIGILFLTIPLIRKMSTSLV